MSPYIDLAVGLALAFLILSLLVSGIQEAFTRALNVRSKFLWAFLSDQFATASSNVRSKVPDSLPKLLQMAWSRLARGNRRNRLDPRPAYQPATSAAPGATSGSSDLNAFYHRLCDIDRAWFGGGKTHIASIPASRVASAFLELASMQAGTDTSRLTPAQAKSDVAAWIDTLKGTPLYQPLRSAWMSANEDLDKFHAHVSQWFDAEMTRMSNLYRRHVRWIMLGIALFIALFTQFDSIAYARTILHDEAFRSQVVAVAQGNPDKLDELVELCHALQNDDEVTKETGTAENGSPTGESTNSGSAAGDSCFQEVLANPSLTHILGDSLIVVTNNETDSPSFKWRTSQWWDRMSQPAHWPGLALTVVALMFGAPFWWDVLRRLTGRSSPSTK